MFINANSFLCLLFWFSIVEDAIGQEKITIADFEVIGHDTIFLSDLPEVEILEFKSKEDRSSYFIFVITKDWCTRIWGEDTILNKLI